jgi:hypothetical protein
MVLPWGSDELDTGHIYSKAANGTALLPLKCRPSVFAQFAPVFRPCRRLALVYTGIRGVESCLLLPVSGSLLRAWPIYQRTNNGPPGQSPLPSQLPTRALPSSAEAYGSPADPFSGHPSA